jgi:hypothetical protein
MVPGQEGLFEFLDKCRTYVEAGGFSIDAAVVFSISARRLVAGRLTITHQSPSDAAVENLGTLGIYRCRRGLRSVDDLLNGVTSGNLRRLLPGLPKYIAVDLKFAGPVESVSAESFFQPSLTTKVARVWGRSGQQLNSSEVNAVIGAVKASAYFEVSGLTSAHNLRLFPETPNSEVAVPLEFELPIAFISGEAGPTEAVVHLAVKPILAIDRCRVWIRWSSRHKAARAELSQVVEEQDVSKLTCVAQYPAISEGENVSVRVLYDDSPIEERYLTRRARNVAARIAEPEPDPEPTFDAVATEQWSEIYDELGPLGEGGFGRVLRVRHRQTSREFALKLLLDPAEDATRLAKEISALRDLKSPHIVEIVQTAADLSWYTMPVADGDLQSKLADLFEAHVLDAVADLILALQEVHSKQLIHRDVTPSNLLWFADRSPHWRLSDFGLVRRFPGKTTRVLTTSRIGTPAFMSPESIADPHNVDHRADLYSLGQIMGWAITGSEPVAQRPFALEGPWSSLVARLTADRRSDRPGSAAEVYDEFKTIRQSTLVSEKAERRSTQERSRLAGPEEAVLRWLLVEDYTTVSGLRGKTDLGFRIDVIFAAADRLHRKGFLRRAAEQDYNGDTFEVFRVTDEGRQLITELILGANDDDS